MSIKQSIRCLFSPRVYNRKIILGHFCLLLILYMSMSLSSAQSSRIVGDNCSSEQIHCVAISEISVIAEDFAAEEEYRRLLPSVLSISLFPSSDYRLLTQEVALLESASLRSTSRIYNQEDYIDGIEFELEIDLAITGGETILLGYLQSIDDEWFAVIESEVGAASDILNVANRFSFSMINILDKKLSSFDPRKLLLTCFTYDQSGDTDVDFFAADLNDMIFVVTDSLPEFDVELSDFGGAACSYEGDQVKALTADDNIDGVLFGSTNLENEKLRTELTLYISEEDQFHQLAVIDTNVATYLDHKNTLREQTREYLEALLSDKNQWNQKILNTSGRSVFNILPFISRVGNLLNNAETSLEAGELETAAILARNAINIDSNSVRGHYILGKVRYEQQAWGAAIDQLNQALDINPAYIDAFLILGNSYEQLQSFEFAISTYEALLALDSNNYAANLALSNALYNQRKYEEARDYASEATRLAPNRVEGFLQLISIANALNDTQGVIDGSISALEVDSDNLEAQRRLATAMRRQIISQLNSREYRIAYDQAVLWTTYAPSADAYFMAARTYARAVTFEEIENDRGYNPAIEAYKISIELSENQDNTVNLAILNTQELLLLETRYDELFELNDLLIDPTVHEEVMAKFHTIAALILLNGNYLDEMNELNNLIRESNFDSWTSSWSFDLLKEKMLNDPSNGISSSQSQLVEALISRLELSVF